MALKEAELVGSASFDDLLVTQLPAPHSEIATTVLRFEVPLGGGMLRHTIEFPSNPEDVVDNTPGLITCGLGACADSYAGLRHRAAVLGKPMVTADPHAIPELSQLPGFLLGRAKDIGHLGQVVTHPERRLLKAYRVAAESIQDRCTGIEQLNTESFDLIGHSLGFYIAALEAKANASTYRSVTSLEGVGGEGPHRFRDMALRTTSFVGKELIPNVRQRKDTGVESGWLKTGRLALTEIATDGIRAGSEAWLAGTAEATDLILELKAKGIGVAAVLGEVDAYIDAMRTVEHCRDLFDPLVVIAGANHVDPVIRPWLFAQPIVDSIAEMHKGQA